MQYKIIVDKQPSSNPSSEKKEYIIDIEELRVKGDVYDSLNIEMDRTYVTRRLSLSEYGVLSVLDEPIIQELTEVKIELFEGDNYIYLMDMQGNKFYAEYLIKNDFNDIYATKNEMNSAITQTATEIELKVNQTLEGYSTTEEMNTAIQLSAQSINLSVNQKLKDYATTEEMNAAINLSSSTIMLQVNKKVGEDEFGTQIELNYESVQIAWNNISDYIQFKNAQLQILNNNNNLLMALDKTGQHFYENNGTLIGDIGIIDYSVDNNVIPMIAFNLNIENNNPKGMAWGIQKNNSFYPIFYITGAYAPASSEYGGKFVVAGDLEATNITCARISGPSSLSAYELSGTKVRANTLYSKDTSKPGPLIHTRISSTNYYLGYAMAGCQTTHFYNCELVSGNICFYVDGEYTGEVSDKRLKSNIESVSNKLVDTIGNAKLYQFKTKTLKDKIKVGIIAQELIEELNKNSIDEEAYALIGKIIYDFKDKKEYYKVDYEQFLLLRQMYLENKVKDLEEKIKQMEVI